MIEEEVAKCIYDGYVTKINHIYEVFQEYFGENNVDLQDLEPFDKTFIEFDFKNAAESDYEKDKKNIIIIEELKRHTCAIIIHFAEVEIKNEYNQSTIAKDLWVRVELTYIGTIKNFYLFRSTYSENHIEHNYMHSHVPSANFNLVNVPYEFCKGRGPINKTMFSLKEDKKSEDADLWGLFCLELDMCIHTESVKGVPYKYIKDLQIPINSTKYTDTTRYHSALYLKDFSLKPLIEKIICSNKLKFCYSQNTFDLSLSFADRCLLYTEIFIDWVNSNKEFHDNKLTIKSLLERGIIAEIIYNKGNILFIRSNGPKNVALDVVGKKVLTFKGKDIVFKIEDIKGSNPYTKSYFLCPNVVNFISSVILDIVNYNYSCTENENINKELQEVFC